MEVRWWNLAGFLLRPGKGYPLDDFRIKELWKLILNEQKKTKAFDVQVQKWICYRRIAYGLTKGQQVQLAHELISSLLNKKTGKIEIKNQTDRYAYSEKIRTVAALELIDISLKINLGNAILTRILSGEAMAVDYWALGRIGSRQLLQGSFTHVVPAQQCATWVEKLIEAKKVDHNEMPFLLAQLSRKTEHRELNLPKELIDRIFAIKEYEEFKEILTSQRPLTLSEENQAYGESLPIGLVLD